MQKSLVSLVSPLLLLVLGGCSLYFEQPAPGTDPPPSNDPDLGPRIITTEQSALYVIPGQAVTFGVVAEDPRGGPLWFDWAISAGSMESVEISANTSRVRWVAPDCARAGIDPQVSVAVTNDLSITATVLFSVSGLPVCPVEDPALAVWNMGGQVDTVIVPQGASEVAFQVWGGGGGGGAPGAGGGGAWLDATFDVTPGDVLEVRVASGGDRWGGGGGASYVLRNGEIMRF